MDTDCVMVGQQSKPMSDSAVPWLTSTSHQTDQADGTLTELLSLQLCTSLHNATSNLWEQVSGFCLQQQTNNTKMSVRLPSRIMRPPEGEISCRTKWTMISSQVAFQAGNIDLFNLFSTRTHIQPFSRSDKLNPIPFS